MMQQKTKLVKQFDKDGDQRLDAAERKAAREYLTTQRATGGGGGRRGGFGRRDGNQEPPGPGPMLKPADVKNYPDAPLYDPTILRTLFLEFENPAWEQELSDFKSTDVLVPAKLTVDGKTYPDVGVHFRGNTSFFMVGTGRKKSLNLSLDYAHEKQQIGGYRTLNLLNSNEDATFLRVVLYCQIARAYFPAPKANLVRVVINGESWGIFANVQQFNKDFMKDNFNTSKGARWKVAFRPGGGQAGLSYVGDDIEAYKRTFDIKSKDDPKAWARLVQLCKVLNTTPADQLEKALAPLLDIEGALKFLAVDNACINNDGYWIRNSDYSLCLDDQGRFHVMPYDLNETFAIPGGPGFGGGPGGGGPGGFNPAMMLVPEILKQGDKNQDKKLSKEEFAALAEAWFDKLDTEKSGKLTQDQFAERFNSVLPMPGGPGGPGRPDLGDRGGPGGSGPGGPGGGGRRFGPGGFMGPGLFGLADGDKDGSVTRAELKVLFEKWHGDWDKQKTGAIDEEQLRNGFTAAIPRPNFGQRGGGSRGDGFGGPQGRGGGPGGSGGGMRGPGGGGSGGGMRVNGVELDPLIAATDPNKPLASKLLAVPSLRARYLSIVKDIAQNWLDWKKTGPIIQQYETLINDDVKSDTHKLYTYEEFVSGLAGTAELGAARGPERRISLKAFMEQRRNYLLNYSETKNTTK